MGQDSDGIDNDAAKALGFDLEGLNTAAAGTPEEEPAGQTADPDLVAQYSGMSHQDLSDVRDYEAGAAQGHHLCNAFNSAVGVPEDRRHAIDMNRRETAGRRLAAIDTVLAAPKQGGPGGQKFGRT